MEFVKGRTYTTRDGRSVVLVGTNINGNVLLFEGGLSTFKNGRRMEDENIQSPDDIVGECHESNILMEPNIDFTKPVQTSNGRKVTIFTTEANGAHPVVGQIEGNTTIERWSITGKTIPGYSKGWDDLVNTKVKKIVFLGPEDIRPGDLIKRNTEINDPTWEIVAGVKKAGDGGYYLMTANARSFNFKDNLYNFLISHDNGKTWQPCTKEIEE